MMVPVKRRCGNGEEERDGTERGAKRDTTQSTRTLSPACVLLRVESLKAGDGEAFGRAAGEEVWVFEDEGAHGVRQLLETVLLL
eukprot:CAMPEP_0119475224 /NCGR_PEP_ID=MMETSP1344-20130328/6191_1 /TAXON_ID=236787 /ORGANISM="Florenciella parvula, Strain CCMP2471" /LENGTH=83 /DNA_ID=CAMNT_0007508691 /DNA_START=46 /DNA_END=297 /DNA_ORIENTATION=+